MKNKSIIKKFVDDLLNNEINELTYIFRDGPYRSFNVQDVIDIHPEYLMWYYREGVFKFAPYIMGRIQQAINN